MAENHRGGEALLLLHEMDLVPWTLDSASSGGDASGGAAAAASPVDGLSRSVDGLCGPVHGLFISFVFSIRLTEEGRQMPQKIGHLL